jgi:hypothetical protein
MEIREDQADSQLPHDLQWMREYEPKNIDPALPKI